MSLSSGNKDLSEVLTDFLTVCARWVLGLGAVASMVATAFLVVTILRVSDGAGVNMADAIRNVQTFQKILFVGLLGVGVGSTYLFWGEDLTGALQLVFAGALWFAPVYLPLVAKVATNEATGQALGALQTGGALFGGLAIVVLVVDIFNRVRSRAKHGVKADQLKYGKGVKEDSDKQNVFMGKCWQLPFCRKFVRERCPIYHAKTTCWKEKVGCMCEEEVIRNAMENKPIPKDQLLASKMIPRNQRLNEDQKKERCRNCVIYNEHQRHKYRLLLPATILGFLAIYGIFRIPLLGATQGVINAADKVIQGGTLGAVKGINTPHAFVELLLVMFMIVGLSYALKMLEFLVFKLKV